MKITVDLEEFWIDSDTGKLTEELRHYVVHSTVSEIYKKIQDQIADQITKQCNEIIKSKIDHVIAEKIDQLVEAEVIIYNREEIKISDHIRNLFMNNHGWNNPNDKMKSIADSFGKELKIRYDKVFATHIVMALKNQGMLKDDVAKMLIENNPNN